MNRAKVIYALVATAVLYWAWSSQEIKHSPGSIAPDEPVQTSLDRSVKPWELDGFKYTPLAQIDLRARLLRSERYRFDEGAAMSPVDFALGWGRMSDSAVIDQLSISQYGRFYYYAWRGQPPIPASEIVRSSANMHLVPSTDAVKRTLFRARAGQVVALSGKLVQIDGPGGWKWKSSLTRSDSGAGACELVWVEDVELLDIQPEDHVEPSLAERHDD